MTHVLAGRCIINGKDIWTEYHAFLREERKGSRDPYQDALGQRKNQGTFVGFFPADAPKYTILVTVYSYASHKSFYGGTLPALAVREIVDKIYALDSDWRPQLRRTAHVPDMKTEEK